MWVRICSVASLAVVFCAAHAQTFYGPGGLIINPTAYSNRTGYFELNSSFFNRQTGGTTTSVYPSSLTYAPTNRFEVGALYIGQREGSSEFDEGGVYFKQGLVDERGSRPALALVGTSVTGQGTFSSLTLVGSKAITPGLHLHMGARYVDESADTPFDGNGFAGFDYALSRKFKLIGEADSRLKMFRYGSEAFGIQYNGPVIGTIGFVDQASGRLSFFVGVGYPMGQI